jgi:hypothetical protein
VTGDSGATWTPVGLEGGAPLTAGIEAAPDGTFRMTVASWAGTEREIRVYRVTPSGESTQVGPAVAGGTVLDPVVDDDGSTWFLTFGSVAGLHIVRPDGSILHPGLPNTSCQPCPGIERTLLGPRLVIGPQTFRLEGSTLVPAEANAVFFVDGSFWLGGEMASWDGGAHWAQLEDAPYTIPRPPGLGGPGLFLAYSEGSWRIATRYSQQLLRATGLALPQFSGELARVVDAGDTLVAWGAGGISVHRGPLPPFPESTGVLEPDTRAMVERANVLRADAGLPPLAGDPLISVASRNHSRYTALNGPDEWAHDETPGKPGYTGSGPSERCTAVGTSCGGEVMFPSWETDPVGGWLATPFHRTLPGHPEAGIVGAGQVEGGWATMNYGADLGVLIDAFGYPNRTWRGDPSFAGEVPDPVATCKSRGQQIEYPVGIAVSLYVPVEGSDAAPAVDKIVVRRRSTGQPQAGCLLVDRDVGHFVLDDPLVPGETYDAEGIWSAGGLSRTLVWSFAYTPEAPEPAPRLGGGRSVLLCMRRRPTLVAGSGELVRGTRRRDVVLGLRQRDRIRSGAGNDFICSRAGADRILTGTGDDQLQAGPGSDSIGTGPGRDTIDPGAGRDRSSSGAGNDLLELADGQRDRANCGSGRDRVVADRVDQLRGCEQIRRRRARSRLRGL